MNIEMARLLSDMRQLREMAVKNDVLPKTVLGPGQTTLTPQAPKQPDFVDVLGQAINHVNDIQQEAGALKKAFDAEVPGVDLTQVMVASQKASLATTAVIQVRNKMVQAYEEIMKMPV